MLISRLTIFTVLLLCVSALYAQVKINEVMLNPPNDPNDPLYQTLSNCADDTDGSEWIEVFNESQCDTIDLSCFILAGQYTADNGGAFAFPIGTKLAPLDFVVIGGPNVNEADFVVPYFCNLNTFCSPDTWDLPNDAGWIALYDDALEVVDAVFWTASSGQANTLGTNQIFGYSPCVPDQCLGTSNLEAAADMTPGNEILYAGEAPSNGQSIYRTTDGSGNWQTNGTPSIGACNGTCLPPSDLAVIIDIAQDATCERNNGSIAVSASGGTPGYEFEWSNETFSDTLNDLESGTYTVTLSDADGCVVIKSVEIDNIGEALEAEIIPADTSILKGDSVRLRIISNNTIFSARWDPFIYLSCGLCTEPYAVPDESTTYAVELEDANGCTATASSSIKVIPDENSVFIPTAFTPNGDNLNDILYVRSPRLSSLVFEVFDRWGKMVFRTTDVEQGWAGTYPNGKAVNEGVYMYVVEAEFDNGKSKVFKGNVTLLR
ncbi:MAG: gliding motility-associated C-terminal domain-containing protein [Chitinophagales bacterium]